MTPTGGAYGLGVIYEASPNGDGGWTFRVIHAFTGGNDGATGAKGRLTLDARGALYGVATAGGQYGSGVAYQASKCALDGLAGGLKTISENQDEFPGRVRATIGSELVKLAVGNRAILTGKRRTHLRWIQGDEPVAPQFGSLIGNIAQEPPERYTVSPPV